MKKFYLFLLVFLLVNIYISCFAQTPGMLTGKVLDDKNEGIGFANVAVIHATTAAVVTGAVADMEGNFQIKTPSKGTYKLQISGVGFVQQQTAPFEVSSEGFSKNFGNLQLKPDSKTLQEVQVQAMRPTIEMHPDKMVVSVEGTVMAEGSTAYDVLAKSPGVWIDQEGNIQLNGKAGVQIMLDGKLTYMSGKDLQHLLQSMPAENLKNLEIITSPSARYDAAGASGMININLKKNSLYGMNGSIYGGYGYNRLHTYNTGASINYKYGRWNTSGTLEHSNRRNYRDIYMGRIFNRGSESFYFDQNGEEVTRRGAASIRLTSDYDFNNRHSIGITTYLTQTRHSGDFDTESYLRNPMPENDLHVLARNHTTDKSGNGTFNLHYTGKPDTLGTTISADLDYVRLGSQGGADFRNTYKYLNTQAPLTTDALRTYNPTSYDIYAAKVDVTRKAGKKGQLETGAKASHVISDNELLFYQSLGEQEFLDKDRSNHFIYKENIFAAYASYTTPFGKKWSLQAGLRGEQTYSQGYSETTNQTTDRSYFDLFPTLFLQQKVNDNYQIGYKLNRRISRPNYSMLNPFVFYLDPYTRAIGNPYLRPQYTNTIEVTQSLKNTYHLVLNYAVTKDYIAEIPLQINPDSTVFIKQNMKRLNNAGATLIVPVKVSSKWQMNNTLMGFYQEYWQQQQTEMILNNQFTVIVQSNHTLQLPLGLKMEVNGGYRGPSVYGLYNIKGIWWVDAGLKRSFMEDKLTVALNANDIFRSNELLINSNLNGNFNTINQYQGLQSLRLNVRYNFNKGKEFDARRRNTNLDELNRAGGS